ncbi:MAG: tetratricopeptide repeat protein [Longimicrobiales bacterium]
MSAALRILARVSVGALIIVVPAGCTHRLLGTPVAPPRSVAVRAELAAVLLNAGSHAEAADEYQRLLATDEHNVAYRLGLARALAWDERYREAEAHLRLLAAWRPNDSTIRGLLRSVRANITPSARQAAAWLAESHRYTPYRLALARALMREGRPSGALAHYDTLLATRATSDLIREAADAHTAANEHARGAAVLRWHVARRPADVGIRHALANLLAADGQLTAALAQTDTILSITPAPDVLVDRARIHIMRGDLASAEADLRASLAIAPTLPAFLLLGDVHRWRLEFAQARSAYAGARSLRPRDRRVSAAFAQLARAERPAPLGVELPAQAAGGRVRLSALRDNAGIDYIRTGAQWTFASRPAFNGTAALEYRHLREASVDGALSSSGLAAQAAVSRFVTDGPLLGALEVSGGAVLHEGTNVMPTAGALLLGGYQAWAAAVELATGPAYPTLLTVASLLPDDPESGPLRERTLTVSVGGPLGPADAGITWQRADISDGNSRSAFTLLARYPVAPSLAAVYAGSSIAYAARSRLYWDPEEYLANAVGVELTKRRFHGFSYAAQGLIGVALAEESPFLRRPVVRREAASARLQASLAGEIGYRREGWAVAASYRFGQVSRYRRSDGTITVQIVP